MDQKGQLPIMGIALSALVFIVVLTVYATVYSQMNTLQFTSGVRNLIALIPLVLVGATIVAIIVVAFKLSN